jgi:hypothetical protein
VPIRIAPPPLGINSTESMDGTAGRLPVMSFHVVPPSGLCSTLPEPTTNTLMKSAGSTAIPFGNTVVGKFVSCVNAVGGAAVRVKSWPTLDMPTVAVLPA